MSSSILKPLRQRADARQKNFGIKARGQGHNLVVKTALEMANEVFEKCASDNEWYKANPSRQTYVKAALPFFIPMARATLTDLMTTTRDESLQNKIYEALCLDAQFVDRIVS